MGLDYTELLLNVEQTFGITIDEDANDIRTVGHLYDYVLSKLGYPGAGRACHAPAAFARLRSALVDELGVSKEAITPRAKLVDLFPWRHRRRDWRRFRKALNAKLPPLEWPRALLLPAAFLWCGVCAPLGAFLMVYLQFENYALVFAAFLAPQLLLFVPFLWATCNTFPLGFRTVGDMVHWLPAAREQLPVADPISVIDSSQTELDRVKENETWAVLKRIIVDTLGVKPERVTKTAHLFEDLGMG